MFFSEKPELHLGAIQTVDPTNPLAEAMIVCGDTIAFVGSRADARALAPGATIVDHGDGAILPGFVDSHLHLMSFGTSLLRHADLIGVGGVDELLSRMEAHAGRYDGPWLQGRGWDQDRMGGRFPTRADLDRVSPNRPMVVTRVCGHAIVVNSKALETVTESERAAGDPETGLYTETAISPFYALVPPLSDAEAEDAVLRASDVALQTGITSVGTLLDTSDQMRAYHRLNRKSKLPIRVTAMPPFTSVAALHDNGVATGFGDDFLRFGGTKLFSDGSLGARTALLAAPYADENNPDNLGIRIYEPGDLAAKTKFAHDRGWQIVIHAIGDQAVRESVEAIVSALGDSDNLGENGPRHRIEHVSLLPPDLLQTMRERRILAVVQPQFVTSDTWTGERVGPERAGWAYAFESIRAAGIPLALSSDCPVEKLDSRLCLAAATYRHAWSEGEKLTFADALAAYTLGSAHALHFEKKIGSLTAGKLADFVVIEPNPQNLSEGALRQLEIRAVYVGGEEAGSGR